MGAIDNSEPIFDNKLLEFSVNVTFASDACKEPGGWVSRCGASWCRDGLAEEGLAEVAVPAANGFVVNLRRGSFDSFLCLGVVGLLGGVVPSVDFKHALKFLGGDARSLPE